ncbi:MAG: DUF2807 domain-containing protein [Acidobacteriota bacterium]|nr:MAG: DUF2807 domain-containing protein [Acidobacteriota bacterium]
MTTRPHTSLYLLSAALAAVWMTGCFVVNGFATVKGSGNTASEQRSVGPFERIEIQGSADAIVQIGEPQQLNVEADDNILGLITTEVRGETLVISSKESYSSRRGVTVMITVPKLEAVEIAGSGDVTIEGLAGDVFEAEVRGSGDIVGRGTVSDVEAVIKGSGDIDLSSLIADRARASIFGSGDIDLHATQAVDLSIRGSGDITYRGKPEVVKKSVLGSGDIKPR